MRTKHRGERTRSPTVRFLIGLARGFAGALIFALPMLMTMEMWWIGFYIDPLRLAVLTAISFPLLVALSYYVGFERTPRVLDDLLDACAAYGVAIVTALVVLAAFNVIGPRTTLDEIVGKVALQAVPASIGALLAQGQLGPASETPQPQVEPGYPANLLFMAVGGLFLAFSIAPTEEVILIAQKMSIVHTVATVLMSVVVMHAFVYSVEFSGSPNEPAGTPWWSLFARYTIVGYAIVLATDAGLLWVFGRTTGLSVHEIVASSAVLAFPSSVGAAAARLML